MFTRLVELCKSIWGIFVLFVCVNELSLLSNFIHSVNHSHDDTKIQNIFKTISNGKIDIILHSIVVTI